MNRTRLMKEVSDIRKNLENHLRIALGEYYNISVQATTDHMADRLLDRSASVKRNLLFVSQIVDSLGKHYACNLLHFALKGGMQKVVAWRRHEARNFVVALTVQVTDGVDGALPNLYVRLRTVIPEFSMTMSNQQAIKVDYQYPKIQFEYDGYRRTISRLTRLIESTDCPEQLKVLRVS